MEKSNITLLGDRVLTMARKAKETEKGGILIPESATEKPNKVEVVSLGDGKLKDGKTHTFSVSVGDIVIISPYTGTAVKYNDVEYLIFREEEILGIINQ